MGKMKTEKWISRCTGNEDLQKKVMENILAGGRTNHHVEPVEPV